MAVKLMKTSKAAIDIEENFPERILSGHKKLNRVARHHYYLQSVYGGPSLSDMVSVSVDVSFAGDPPRFIISGVLYTPYQRIGKVSDHLDTFHGIQRKTAEKYLK